MNSFTASDGRRIAYSDTGGDGPVVLCLAGLTRDQRDFIDLAAHLGAAYRVIAMDYRGRGQSEWAENPLGEYTPPVEGRDAVELLAHLAIPDVTLLGTSRGGLIGMGLAAQAPALVRALILNDIGPVIDDAGIRRIMSYLGRPLPYANFEAAAQGLKAAYAGDAPTVTDAQWLSYARNTFHDDQGHPILSYDPKLRDSVAAAIEGPQIDLWPVYDAISCPLLVLRGANSNLFSAATLDEMQRRKPALTATIVPDRGHCPFLDEPEALAAIDTFLARQA
ncbi:MAG: alpha/beta hydrolase [Pseudomonadota bacterium]